MRANGQLVLDDNGLPVEDKGPAGVPIQLIENDVDRIDQACPKFLAAPVPLSVLVGV
jgi:hypothetical protein